MLSSQLGREPSDSRRPGPELHDFSPLLQSNGLPGASRTDSKGRGRTVATQHVQTTHRVEFICKGRGQAPHIRVVHLC